MKFSGNVLVKPIFVNTDEFEKIKGMFTGLDEKDPTTPGQVKGPDDLRFLQAVLNTLCINPDVSFGADLLPGVVRVFAVAGKPEGYPGWETNPLLGGRQVMSVIDTGPAGAALQHFFAVEQPKVKRGDHRWHPGDGMYGGQPTQEHMMMAHASGGAPLMAMTWRVEFILDKTLS